MARQFGIITTSAGVTGIVTNSMSTKESADVAEARDENGKVTDVKAYSRRTTFDIRGVMDSASIAVHAGDSVTLGGKTCIVKSVDVSESNTGFAEASVSAEAVDSAAVSAYDGGTTGTSETTETTGTSETTETTGTGN